jgi:Tol biopolymer transport system component
VISDGSGAPSSDGRYLSFTNWYSGNLAVRDLTTGEHRNLTDEGTWDEPDRVAGCSVWSPDGVQIAYGWLNEDHWELRIVGFHGSKPRVLCCDEKIKAHYGIIPYTWSQDGKHILARFYRNPSPGEKVWEIVLVSVADGSARILRSLKGMVQWSPMSLSPDGRYVAYSRPVEGHGRSRDIFLLATDGSGEEVPLVEHPADDYGPIWTPDGKAIVFVSDRSSTYDAWLMQAVDGKPVGEPQLIRKDTGPMKPMGFTRQGSLYYRVYQRSFDIYTASIDPETGELLAPPTRTIRQFEGLNSSPAWSPDGKSLAYVSLRPSPGSARRRGVLVIRSMETGEEREFYPKVELHPVVGSGSLRWSPDGRYILCANLHITDTQTGDITVAAQVEVRENTHAAWSSDGRTIFYIREDVLHRSIVAHDLETGKEREFCQKEVGWPGLAVSPDGQQIAFAGGNALKVMPAEGGEARELLRLPDNELFGPGDGCTSFAWTPDGRYVLFRRFRRNQPEEPPMELWRIPSKGGEPQKLLEMHGLREMSVHPDGQRIFFPRGTWMQQVWAMENFLPGFTAGK